jgi:Ca2+-binding EF-hand superfamily protein
MNKKQLSILFIVIAMVLPLVLFAQATEPEEGFKQYGNWYTFRVWDELTPTDDDTGGNYLERSEFITGLSYSGAFNEFNKDKDVGVSLDELRPITSDLYDSLNTNKDGMLTKEEFTQGTTDLGIFENLDKDNNQRLSQEEFSMGLFNYWNKETDDTLQSQQLGNGLFEIVDLDKDGRIVPQELETFGK